MLNLDDEIMLYAMIDITRSSIAHTVKVVDDTLHSVAKSEKRIQKMKDSALKQDLSEDSLELVLDRAFSSDSFYPFCDVFSPVKKSWR